MKHTTDSENEGKRKTLAKGWKSAIAVVVSAVLLCGAGFGIAVAVPYIEAANFDVSDTPFESPYRLDENGYFVENIPYGDYLVYDAALDRDPTARQPVLSDDADPENAAEALSYTAAPYGINLRKYNSVRKR